MNISPFRKSAASNNLRVAYHGKYKITSATCHIENLCCHLQLLNSVNSALMIFRFPELQTWTIHLTANLFSRERPEVRLALSCKNLKCILIIENCSFNKLCTYWQHLFKITSCPDHTFLRHRRTVNMNMMTSFFLLFFTSFARTFHRYNLDQYLQWNMVIEKLFVKACDYLHLFWL